MLILSQKSRCVKFSAYYITTESVSQLTAHEIVAMYEKGVLLLIEREN